MDVQFTQAMLDQAIKTYSKLGYVNEDNARQNFGEIDINYKRLRVSIPIASDTVKPPKQIEVIIGVTKLTKGHGCGDNKRYEIIKSNAITRIYTLADETSLTVVRITLSKSLSSLFPNCAPNANESDSQDADNGFKIPMLIVGWEAM